MSRSPLHLLHKALASASAMILLLTSASAQVSPEAFSRWHDSKYSMFIHFGLYSELGGVWEGRKITQGYSEQIQSQGGIFSDDYEEVAARFNPSSFDADKIVELAKAAGMKSIVITSKHHDGFCMWRTATTEFNSWDATPVSRDFVDELSKACRKGGIRFGLYFSLIDWHYPYAYPISSSNADPITPEHHRYNMEQVRELLTRYGDISELWFDMGSLTPDQSRDLYTLVHSLQPDCMVSGRLGNDQYDFCVMGDNAFPSGTLKTAWQTPASMFSETWGYRSWQERGSVEAKAAEKLRSLAGVVSHGGNYLLNIGPKGDGSVVDFEKDVLLMVGEWLRTNQDAIYGAEAFEWPGLGDSLFTTQKGNELYIIPSDVPNATSISLPVKGRKLLKAVYLDDNSPAPASIKAGVLKVGIPPVTPEEFPRVVRLTFDSPVEEPLSNVLKTSGKPLLLTAANATEDNSYSCFDYYTNYRSVIGYRWNFTGIQAKTLELSFTEDKIGKEVEIEVDGRVYTAVLSADHPVILSSEGAGWSDTYYSVQRGSFSRRLPSRTYTLESTDASVQFEKTDKQILTKALPNTTVYIARDVTVGRDCDAVVEFAAGNGVEVLLNGESLLKHLNPFHETNRQEKVLVHLKAGVNQILVGAFNKWEKSVPLVLKPSQDNTIYKMTVKLDSSLSRNGVHSIHLKPAKMLNSHSDIEMSDIEIKVL